VSQINEGANNALIKANKQVKLTKSGECVNCRGWKFRDRPKNGYHSLKLRLIKAGKAQGTSLNTDKCNEMSIHVINVVISMYFIYEGRINGFKGVIQPSDWL